MNKNSKIYKSLDLFKVFFKIGLFTFGGGYAMIPFIQKEIVEKNKWITDEEILDMFAIAEATPGVIAVNTATFVGYKIAGFWGSFFATLGVVVPSFLIILLIAYFIKDFLGIKVIANAFKGIRAGVIVLIIGAIIKFSKSVDKNIFNLALAIIAFLLSAFTNVNTILILLGALITGIVFNVVIKRREI